MGLLGSKQKNQDINTKPQYGGKKGITKGIADDRTDFDYNEGCGCANDQGYLLQRLAQRSSYGNINYLRGGNDNPHEMNLPPFDIEDIDMTPYRTDYDYKPRKQRHLQYQKDILTLLKGGNVADSDLNADDYNVYAHEDNKNRDTDLDDIKNIYNENNNYNKNNKNNIDEGCGCAGDRIYYGGKKQKKYIVDDDEDELDLFAHLIHAGGKRKRKDESSINLSSTNSTSSIASSSSFGYKTSNDNQELKVMPFYSTPDSSSSSVGGNRATPLSTTSTLYSNTSSASLSAKNYNISTTSDNFLARPVSKKRY